MKLLYLAAGFIAISACLQAAPAEIQARDKMPFAYFLEQVPATIDVPDDLPNNAKDVVIARVRLTETVSWLGGRDQSGEPPRNLPKDIFFTRIRITETRLGSAAVGQVFDVRFGLRSEKRAFVYPYTPDQFDRDYTVVMYLDADGQHRLAAFPISQSQYSQWEAEQSAYSRLRGKPGFRE